MSSGGVVEMWGREMGRGVWRYGGGGVGGGVGVGVCEWVCVCVGECVCV